MKKNKNKFNEIILIKYVIIKEIFHYKNRL